MARTSAEVEKGNQLEISCENCVEFGLVYIIVQGRDDGSVKTGLVGKEALRNPRIILLYGG